MLEVKLYLTLESENLTELGAKVVGVDTNLQKITNYKKLGIPIFVCDFLNFPFQKQVADLVVFTSLSTR